MRDEPLIVTRGEERRWDAPQLGEAPVLGHDFPLTVHDEDAVGGGFECGLEQRDGECVSPWRGGSRGAPRAGLLLRGGLAAPFGHG